MLDTAFFDNLLKSELLLRDHNLMSVPHYFTHDFKIQPVCAWQEIRALETVPHGQLAADAGAVCSVSDYTVDPGLNDESVALGRDAQTDSYEVLAVKGWVLVYGETVDRPGAGDFGIIE